jgi:hypothetical protein
MGKLKYSEKTFPQCQFAHKEILHDFGSNPGHCHGKPATNPLRYGTANSENICKYTCEAYLLFLSFTSFVTVRTKKFKD